jgi:Domain of unknown function (DUF4388)
LNTKNTLRDREILDVIGILSSNGESGRLNIQTGTTEGALFFNHGKLVDGRVGNLTGFQAINAVASIRDANLSFDTSVAPPSSSSIKPSERVVLKQFFGIETADPEESHDAATVIWPDEDLEPKQVVPLEAEQYISDTARDDEVTLVRSQVPPTAEPAPVMPMPYEPPSRSPYRIGLMLALMLVLTAAAAFAVVYKFRQRNAVASVATTAAPSSAPVAATPVAATPVAEPVKQTNDEGTPPAQDLTGKWTVVNTVEKTSYQSFKNLQIGFDLSINQNGNGFTGKGEKVSENGRSLPAGSRTPILVKGSIEGDRVEATFSEQGVTRKTNGRFVWRIDKAGALTGTFVSTAAAASGKSAARKEL